MLLALKQLDMSTPKTTDDRTVNSWSDEFLKPPIQAGMQTKYGQYAKFSNPKHCMVDTSDEVVLNTYPDGPTAGRIEQTAGVPLEKYEASLWDENFFRKHVLKPKMSQDDHERTELLDFMLNATMMGGMLVILRCLPMLVWNLGQPPMTMVGQMNIEAEIGEMQPKQCKTVVWRGKPVYAYKRSEHMIKQVDDTPMSVLKHPETDIQRFPTKRDMAVVIAICTHLGCIPIPNEGIYMGFFCPCHGSHYDYSGRIRQGPAPLNLEVPPYKWLSEDVLYLGTI